MGRQHATGNGDAVNANYEPIYCRAPYKVPVGVALFNNFSLLTQNLVVDILAKMSYFLAGSCAFSLLDSMLSEATLFLQYSLAAVAYVSWMFKLLILPKCVREYFDVPSQSPWLEVYLEDLKDEPTQEVALDKSERSLSPWTQAYLENPSTKRIHKKVLLPVSMINNIDPTFDVPTFYKASQFPYPRNGGSGWGYNDRNVHLLSLLIKLSYENTSIILTVMKRPELFHWDGWTLNNKFYTEMPDDVGVPVTKASQFATNQVARRIARDEDKVTWQERYIAKFIIPKTRAFIFSNDKAAVVVFRGTEPTNLVQWATDAQIGFVSPAGYVKGKVHNGFYQALFYEPESQNSAIFWQICRHICQFLDTDEETKAVFVTGHSLGGALTSVFAHAVACIANSPDAEHGPTQQQNGPTQEQRKLCKRIHDRILAKGCVVTFAGPMVGDGEFMAYSSMAYGYDVGRSRDHCLIRVVHAADIVPQVPFYQLLYRHHTQEFYITTFGWLLHMPQDVEVKRSIEMGPVMYWLLFLYKLVFGLVAEFPVRTLERLMLWWIPLSDHWPCDYERKLRYTTKAVVKNEEE